MREEDDEERLMEAYVGGDAGAFDRLFRSLAPSLHAFFARTAGRGPVADDLLQTTFLKIHAGRRAWNGARLRPWVFTIAARVWVDWLRRQGRSETVLEGEELEAIPDTAGTDPGGAAATQETADRVRAAMDALPEPQRAVLHLHRFEGLSFAEIGQVLGISEGAARVRAFRAHARLRELLADLVEEVRP